MRDINAEFKESVNKHNSFIRWAAFHFAVNPVYSARHPIRIEGSNSIDPGSLIIANHESYDDIPLTGMVLKRTTGRILAHAIMRHNLPQWYLRIGGIPIWRTQELRDYVKTNFPVNAKDPEEKKEEKARRSYFLEQMPGYYNSVWSYTSNCLANGRDVLFFPSGSRKSTEFHTEGIVGLSEAYWTRNHEPLSVVPLALHYNPKGELLRQPITARIGDTILCKDNKDAEYAICSLRELIQP